MKTNYSLSMLYSFYFIFITLLLTASFSSTGQLKQPARVYINLMLPSGDSVILVDGVATMYENRFSTDVNQEDAIKFPNFNENICLMRDGFRLAIEARPVPLVNDTLFLNMWGIRQQNYFLDVAPKSLPPNIRGKGWIEDKYLHIKKILNLYDSTNYLFTVTADTATYRNRFMVVFLKTAKEDNNATAQSTLTQPVIVYPNPADNTFSVQFLSQPAGSYYCRLFSNNGNIIISRVIQYYGDNTPLLFSLPAGALSGKYNFTVFNRKGTVYTGAIMITP